MTEQEKKQVVAEILDLTQMLVYELIEQGLDVDEQGNQIGPFELVYASVDAVTLQIGEMIQNKRKSNLSSFTLPKPEGESN